MINENPEIILSVLNSNNIIFTTCFSPYVNNKEKYEQMSRKDEIININEFYSAIKSNYNDYSSYINKEHYLEFSSKNFNNSKTYENWQTLPKELNENTVIVDLGTFSFREQCNPTNGYISDYICFIGTFPTLNLCCWFKHKDIYIKVLILIQEFLGYSQYKIRFYPKNLKKNIVASAEINPFTIVTEQFMKLLINDIVKKINKYL